MLNVAVLIETNALELGLLARKGLHMTPIRALDDSDEDRSPCERPYMYVMVNLPETDCAPPWSRTTHARRFKTPLYR